MNSRPAVARRSTRLPFIPARRVVRIALFATVVLASLLLVSASAPAGSGLVAAYAFDEGTGATAADASGNGNAGTLLGAGWGAGQSGNAVSLDGSSGSVSLPNLGTFYKTAFTFEAWVKSASASPTDAAVLGTWTGGSGNGGPMLWIDTKGVYELTLGNNGSQYLYSGVQPNVGQWQFVAGTYDGTTAKIYVDGTLAASESFSGNVGDSNTWRVGAYSSSPAGLFNGLIDNVRIYSRALSGSEISSDMASAVTPDTNPPSAPGTLTATGSIGNVNLLWGAASDDSGVTQYDVYRSTTSGFTPSAANKVGQVNGTTLSYSDGGLASGTYYYRVTAEDQAGNVGPASNEASATAGLDSPPTVTLTAPTGGSTVNGVVALTATASDDGGVASVQFKIDGNTLGDPDTSAPYSVNWDTRGEVNGTHTVTAVAKDNGGQTASDTASVTVTNTISGVPPVASYAMDETSGSVVHDSSGNVNNATAQGGTSWASAGRYGGALSLDGSTGYAALGNLGTFYKSAFTFEAWVKVASNPSDAAIVGTWAGDGNGGPMLWLDGGGVYELTLGKNGSSYLYSGQHPTVGQWQFVAGTYDGATASIYVDGTLASSASFTGNVGDSTAWRIGAYGATATGFLNGQVDNVRIYNRALTAAQIQTDMATRVPGPDLIPPTAPTSLQATGAIGKATLSWGASSDDIGVTGYDVYRSTTSGFTPSAANKIASVSGATTTYADATTAGTYYYRVTASDHAGNVSSPSNQASAVVTADTTAPTVSLTAPAAGGVSGIVVVTASASDNIAVASVQLQLDGQSLGSPITSAPYSGGWDTRGELNGTHTLRAVATDTAGNSTTSAPVTVTVSNAGVSQTGLVAAYGMDDSSGSIAADSSTNHNTATLSATGSSLGSAAKYGTGLSLDGTSGIASLSTVGAFYKTGFTLEAWVKKTTNRGDEAVLGTWTSSGNGGPMIWIDGSANSEYELTLGKLSQNYLDSHVAAAVGRWQFVAATFDGTTASIYVDGVLAASGPYSGNVGDSTVWRIGAYGDTATGFLDGLVDNVRIYSRSLNASEIQSDMASRVQRDTTPPTVTAFTPTTGTTGLTAGPTITAKFSEPLQVSTITSSTFDLRDSSNNVVPSTVTYDAASNTATMVPNGALTLGATYRAVVHAGGPKDLFGNGIAADASTTFTVASSPPPILLITSPTNPFTSYLAQILRYEGLNDFWTIDVGFVTQSFLNNFGVAVLGQTSLTSTQVTTFTNWVNSGGNLIAMHPDKQLKTLLGLTDANSTLANAYMKVNTATSPGLGITSSTMQYHGSADKYTLNGATAVATLYSSASTATSNPAVTVRTVGFSGGQAAAFTYDLSQSVIYTRQGNPAWAGQDRDDTVGVRSDDLFFPNWLDTSKMSIPQADEQQRLLVNMITAMERDKMPVPRFWYLPRGLKAAIVMSGDDHGQTGNTASNFDRDIQLSPANCSVALWQCVRATSYVFSDTPLTDAQAKAYVNQGFEVALHPYTTGGCANPPSTLAQLDSAFDTQLAAFQARYPDLPAPVTNRTHCIEWPDWLSMASVELAHGMRMDANYYQFPSTFLPNPGFMNGGGFPMRFADTTGKAIDIYQEMTNMADDSGVDIPSTVDALISNAVGSNGYYGAFGVNVHNDFAAPQSDAEAVIEDAQANGVPVISFKQLLDWTDGHNNSTLGAMSWNSSAKTFTFTTSVASGATGLQTLLPAQGPSGTIFLLRCNGVTTSFTTQTIKGVSYATFNAVNGTCVASYH